MTLLYVTADKVGGWEGGSKVTHHESEAMKTLGECEVWDRAFLDSKKKYYFNEGEPWQSEVNLITFLGEPGEERFRKSKLAHFYAGTFSSAIAGLKIEGVKISYTAAAHDVQKSKTEHEALGIPYDYPHLTDPEQWKRYLQGYLDADLLIVPSKHSNNVMRSYGRTGRIVLIPHGCDLPETEFKPLPEQFTVGYLGSYGPDKGVRYLLEAWKRLDYKDATLLLGGRDSLSPFVEQLYRQFGGGNVVPVGWVENVSDFYNACSCYVQPSVTEGFGIEISEAMAHCRPVLCSTGAGAVDLVPRGWSFDPHDTNTLAGKIDVVRKIVRGNHDPAWYHYWQDRVRFLTWEHVRAKYVAAWKELLGRE